MLFNLLLIYCFFSLSCVVFNNFFTFPAEIELAPAIPTGAPITIANDVIEMLPIEML